VISGEDLAAGSFYGHNYGMKTTMDIPDQLYRQLKARSAAKGMAVREVLIGLIEHWVEGPGEGGNVSASTESAVDRQERAARLRAFLDEAADLMAQAPPGPSSLELLAEGRNRLEKPE
jgi:hypothetical protein